jgi:hypothetical protein
MELQTAGSIAHSHVTDDELREAFRDDARRGEYIILCQQPEIYMQAAGEDDRPYQLEYRDGDGDQHYQAEGELGKEDVERAFRWYFAGDSRWRTGFRWKKLEFKSWWKFW